MTCRAVCPEYVNIVVLSEAWRVGSVKRSRRTFVSPEGAVVAREKRRSFDCETRKIARFSAQRLSWFVKECGYGKGKKRWSVFFAFPQPRLLRLYFQAKAACGDVLRRWRASLALALSRYEQLVGEGDADDLGRFAGAGEPLAEGDEVGFVAAGDRGDDEQQVTHAGAAAADGAPALVLAAVLGERREAGELRHGLVG